MDSTSDPEPAADGTPSLGTPDGATRTGSNLTFGGIELPISERSVSLVGVSRFSPLLRLHFWGSEGADIVYTL